MRITGGIARGIILKSVDESILRPATDYLRQAVFSSLGTLVVDATFLDLFAGTGSYGLEAWSRGALGGIFVENHSKIAGILEKNIQLVKKNLGDEKADCRIWHIDALQVDTEEQFDLIFMDPPYDLVRERGLELLERGIKFLKKSEQSRLIFELPADLELPIPEGVKLHRRIAKRGKNSPAATIYGFAF